ncbi:cilia- and flagella-associated protein 44-like [Narcine bancroftii]|uniref:cilia- and flagella-associated protein 44-like n=1 Tax=Narcine bancroftii TaxID=1343680 RepID=UPI0038313296
MEANVEKVQESTKIPDSEDPDEEDINYMQEGETVPTEEEEQSTKKQDKNAPEERILLDDFFYDHEEICSKPFISPEALIPKNLLTFVHSFGYDSTRRVNLQLIGGGTIIFVAGNLVIFMDIKTKEQKYIRSSSNGGIGIVMCLNSKYFGATWIS